MSDNTIHRPSTPSLLADALSQITTLFETEIRLVRSEISEKITVAITSIAVLVAAAVLMVAALIFLLQGLVELLIFYGWKPFAADFLVGVIIAVIAIAAVLMAKKGLSASTLAPSRSMHQIGKDAHLVKEQVK